MENSVEEGNPTDAWQDEPDDEDHIIVEPDEKSPEILRIRAATLNKLVEKLTSSLDPGK